MCVIFFYVNPNPGSNDFKLIVASNRDEFYARETLDAGRWKEFPHVLGGVDQQPGREGGSWLAVSGKDGIFKLGALLNVTGEPKVANADATCTSSNNLLLGRGMIVSDYVAGDLSAEEYSRRLLVDCEKYSAFNFVTIEISQSSTPSIMLCSNAPKALESFKNTECHGFGNSPSSTPFNKVVAGRERFKKIINKHLSSEATESNTDDLIQHCIELLKDEEKHWPDAELASRAPNWGEQLSALNVKIDEAGYGSRTHTVILIDSENSVHFYEETKDGDKWRCQHIVQQYFRTENGHQN